MTPTRFRLLALAALLGGIVGAAYWPFYSVAYHATPDGAGSGEPAYVAAWAVPFRDAVEPLVTFGTPDEVYTTWGKALTFASLGWIAGLVALRAWPGSRAGKLARASLNLALVSTALLFVASLALYWFGTPSDAAFFALAIPGLLLSMVAYALLGWSLLKAGALPRAAGALFLVGGPAILPLAQPLGSLSGGLVLLSLGWLVTGVAMLRRTDATSAAPAGTRAPEAS